MCYYVVDKNLTQRYNISWEMNKGVGEITQNKFEG